MFVPVDGQMPPGTGDLLCPKHVPHEPARLLHDGSQLRPRGTAMHHGDWLSGRWLDSYVIVHAMILAHGDAFRKQFGRSGLLTRSRGGRIVGEYTSVGAGFPVSWQRYCRLITSESRTRVVAGCFC